MWRYVYEVGVVLCVSLQVVIINVSFVWVVHVVSICMLVRVLSVNGSSSLVLIVLRFCSSRLGKSMSMSQMVWMPISAVISMSFAKKVSSMSNLSSIVGSLTRAAIRVSSSSRSGL